MENIMEKYTNLEMCCKMLKMQGGTIHQYAKILDFETDELLAISPRLLNTTINSYIKNHISTQIKNLKKNQCVLVAGDRITSLMTAVKYITLKKDYTATLKYSDNTEESAKIKPVALTDNRNFLSIVSEVQSKRKN